MQGLEQQNMVAVITDGNYFTISKWCNDAKTHTRLNKKKICDQSKQFLREIFKENGRVKSYNRVDAQISYDFSHTKLNLKIGAANVANKYYNIFLGVLLSAVDVIFDFHKKIL